MKNYVAYHNPDKMGASVLDMPHYTAAHSKRIRVNPGDRVWLLTRMDSPERSYFIRSCFVVEQTGSGTELGFKTKVSGSANTGTEFDPMIKISDADWFPEFQNRLGNFGLGFQRIRDAHFIDCLERAISGY